MPGAEVDAAGGEMDAGGEEMGMADEAAAIVTSALGELGKAVPQLLNRSGRGKREHPAGR